MHAMTRNHREDSRRRALVGIALLLGLASTFGCGEAAGLAPGAERSRWFPTPATPAVAWFDADRPVCVCFPAPVVL